MAYVHIGEIVRLFGDDYKTVTKGVNALNSNHIITRVQDPDCGVLKGEVQESQKDKVCHVYVSFLKSI